MSQDTDVRNTFERLVSGKKGIETGPPLNMDDGPTLTSDTADASPPGVDEIQVVRLTTVPLTDKLANWMINLAEVPGERPLRDDHVSMLVNAMRNGTFRPEIVSLAVCECTANSTVYRENGRHTSWARALLDDPSFAPVVHLHIYRAATMAGVRALYAQYDRGASRTKSNLIESYLADVPPFAAYGRWLRARLASGVAFFEWPKQHDRARHGADAIAALMGGRLKELVVHAASIISQLNRKETRHISRSSTIAAMMATYSVAPRLSTEFWTTVRDGVGITESTDPRLKLRNELTRYAIGPTRLSGKSDKTLSSEQVYRYCISAWNTWRAKKPMIRIQASQREDRPLPK